MKAHQVRRISFLGTVALGAALVLLGCSSEERAPGMAGTPPPLPITGTCETGAERPCSITLNQANGVLNCFRGRQTCDDGVWSSCGDGTVTQELSPLSDELLENPGDLNRRDLLSISSPISCFANETCKQMDAWTGGTSYTEGEQVTHNLGSLNSTGPALGAGGAGGSTLGGEDYYECIDSTHCSDPDPQYEPGAGSNWEAAWHRIGSCLNLCDPSCMYFAEDPPDLTTGSGPSPTIPDWSASAGTTGCDHELCSVGGYLDPTCHACVAKVCDADATCCTDIGSGTEWSQTCIDLSVSECGVDLPEVITPCNFGALAFDEVNISNGSTGMPNLASNGQIRTEDPANLGSLYAEDKIEIKGHNVINGDVVAEDYVSIESDSVVKGNVWAGYKVDVANTSEIEGNLTAGDECTLQANTRVYGDLTCGDDVSMSSGAQVDGTASVVGELNGQANTYVLTDANTDSSTGPLYAESCASGTYTPESNGIAVSGACDDAASISVPTPPDVVVPNVKNYIREVSASCSVANSMGTTNVPNNTDALLTPGIYEKYQFNSGATLTLEPGTYFFQDLRFYSNAGGIRLKGAGPWDIVTCGDYIADGYVDWYYDGTTTLPGKDFMLYSARTSGDCIQIGNNSEIGGIVLAPECKVEVDNDVTLNGVVWADFVQAQTNFEIIELFKEDCEEHDLFAGDCGSTVFYTDGFSYSNGEQVTSAGNIYECTNAANCSAGGGYDGVTSPGYWPGQGPDWTSAWTLVGPCPTPSASPPEIIWDECPIDPVVPETPGPRETCFSGRNCQINSRCEEVVTDASCGHSKCTTGPALDATCDECVALVCAAQSSCCSGSWDASCVALVPTECDASCGALASACTHDVCVTGPGLDPTCGTTPGGIVADVCNALPSCCNTASSTAWNQACVDQVFIEMSQPAPSVPAPYESICDFAVMGGNGTSTLNGTDITGGVGWYAGSITVQALNASAHRPQIDGDVFATGTGTFKMTWTDVNGDVTHGSGPTDIQFSTYDSLSSGSITMPTKPTLSWPNATHPCPTGRSDSNNTSDANGGLDPYDGSDPSGTQYGNVIVNGSLTLQAGDYYVNSFTVQAGHNVTLPASGDVNIYACNSIELGNGASFSGGSGDPYQVLAYVNSGNINFHDGSQPIGLYSTFNGNVALSSNVTLKGGAHSYFGQITSNNLSVIDTSAGTRESCLARGADPANPPSSCPATTPSTGSVTETGTCTENGNSYQVSSSTCSGVDLSVDMGCGTTIPVCNHGNAALTGGDAELAFYTRGGQQFATTSPDATWERGTCPIGVNIPAGTCVDVSCPAALLDQDLTVMARMTSGSECSELDNWSYFEAGTTCSTQSEFIYDYEAVCPESSSPLWGFLSWDNTVPGSSGVTFEARTSHDGSFTGPYTPLGTASTVNERCALTGNVSGCPILVSDTLFGATPPATTPAHLELRITLNPSGPDVPTVHDWQLTYSCQFDQ